MEIITLKLIRNNFFNTSIADILRAVDGKSLMGSLILSFCCIDHITQATKPGQKTTREDYKKSVRNILGKVNIKYKNIDSEIYAIRNSLIHSYGESDSSRYLNLDFKVSINEFKDSHLDFEYNNSGKTLLIDLPKFISEVICSAQVFFHINQNDIKLLYDWYIRQIRVFNVELSNLKLEDFHKNLHHFDKHILINDAAFNLSEEIRKKCSS